MTKRLSIFMALSMAITYLCGLTVFAAEPQTNMVSESISTIANEAGDN